MTLALISNIANYLKYNYFWDCDIIDNVTLRLWKFSDFCSRHTVGVAGDDIMFHVLVCRLLTAIYQNRNSRYEDKTVLRIRFFIIPKQMLDWYRTYHGRHIITIGSSRLKNILTFLDRSWTAVWYAVFTGMGPGWPAPGGSTTWQSSWTPCTRLRNHWQASSRLNSTSKYVVRCRYLIEAEWRIYASVN